MEKLVWISEEELEIIGVGKFKKGAELLVSEILTKQLLKQKLVKKIEENPKKKETGEKK